MLLVIDVGNTNISFGVFADPTVAYDAPPPSGRTQHAPRALLHHVRCESARSRTADEYAVLVRQMLALRGVDASRIDAAIIASVVPPLTDTMVDLVRTAFACDALVVGPGIKTGMAILYENPREVGADRIVNAVAAYEWAKGGVIVVDFGTATTFDCVTPKGEYLGGVITPGVQISAEALFSRAARLHRVEIALPPKVVGRNPVHSMQSGIVYGYAGLVDGLAARLKKELSYPCRVIATGGLARLISPQTEAIEAIDDDLTLTGLRFIYERNEHATRGGPMSSPAPSTQRAPLMIVDD
jgi:type III pantothenate kinase